MATGDIREIDMTKATNLDGKKIRLVGDDGKGYWIEKEDLAAVVGGLLSVEGHSFQSVGITIEPSGEYELPFHAGLLLITNHSGSTKSAAAVLSSDCTGKVLTDEGSQVVFFSNTGGGATVSVYKESDNSHWKIINNRSSQAVIRYSYVTNV